MGKTKSLVSGDTVTWNATWGSASGATCPQCGVYVAAGMYHHCNPLYGTQNIQCPNCHSWYLSGTYHVCSNYSTTYSGDSAKLDTIIATLNELTKRITKIEEILDEEL